ncbi:DNA polymerase III subunit delta [Dehalococcoidia bacterium]|nr:DNA polymerase III subunit delta [Dehalococcoidia bacterium]
MIYLIYGDDNVGVEELLKAMKAAASPDDLGDINVSMLDGQALATDELTAAAFTVPFMADRRLVIVKRLLSRFDIQPQSRVGTARREEVRPWIDLVDELGEMPATTDLVFTDGSVSRGNRLLQRLRRIAEERVFLLPKGNQLSQWVVRRAAAHGVDIEPRAAVALAEAVGHQPMVLDSELAKLALSTDDQRIRREDVQNMVVYVRELTIFQAVDAVVEGRTGDAIRMVRQIVDGGQPVSYVITMIARQVRLLLLVKELRSQKVEPREMGQRLNLPSFAADRARRQEARFPYERLARIQRQLVKTDLAIKTTDVDEQLALDLVIAEMSLG